MKGREEMTEEEEVHNQIAIMVPGDVLLDACIRQIVGYGMADDEYETDGTEGQRFTRAMRKRIDAQITERVDKSLGEILDEEIRARVSPILDEVCAEGFPIFSEYGERKRVEEFSIFVRKAIEGLFSKSSGSYRTPIGQKLAAEAFKEQISDAMKAEMKLLKATIREHVDAKLSGTVVEGLREAIGLSR